MILKKIIWQLLLGQRCDWDIVPYVECVGGLGMSQNKDGYKRLNPKSSEMKVLLFTV